MKSTSYKGDVLRLASGTVVAQGLTVLAVPVLTRLVPPESFGIAALFFSISGIVGTVAALRYDQAIMLPEEDRDAGGLFIISLLMTGFVGILMAAVLFIGGRQILPDAVGQDFLLFASLLPLAVIIQGILQILTASTARSRQFSAISVSKITTSGIALPGQILMGFIGLIGPFMLILTQVAGNFGSLLVLFRARRQQDQKGNVQWRFPDLVHLFKRYKMFPLFSAPSTLIGSVSKHLPSLLLVSFFSPAVAGIYALTNRTLNLPTSIIGSAVAQVFYQRASVARQDNSLPELTLKTVTTLSCLSILPFTVAAMIAPQAFTVIFGDNWLEAGIFARILIPWALVSFITSPISNLNNVFEKQHVGIVFNIVNLGGRYGALLLGYLHKDPRLAIILLSAFSSAVIIIFNIYHLALAEVRFGVLLKKALSGLPGYVGLLLPPAVGLIVFEQSHITILLLGAFSILLHAFLNRGLIKSLKLTSNRSEP